MDFVQQITSSAGSEFCSSRPLKLTVVHSGDSTAYMAIPEDPGHDFEFTLVNFGYQKCYGGHKIFFDIEDTTSDQLTHETIQINDGDETAMGLIQDGTDDRFCER